MSEPESKKLEERLSTGYRSAFLTIAARRTLIRDALAALREKDAEIARMREACGHRSWKATDSPTRFKCEVCGHEKEFPSV